MDRQQTLRVATSAALKGVACAATILSFITAVLLMATIIQLKIHDPAASPVLLQRMERFEKEPANTALRDEIRALDLLARKAYFTSRQQLRYGTVLLLVFMVITLLSVKAYNTITPVQRQPFWAPFMDMWWREQTVSRRVAIGAGLLLAAVALGAGLYTDIMLTHGTRHTADTETNGRNWPFFRGPDGNGISNAKNVPVSWDGKSMRNIRWKSEVPLPGNSSPIVWGNRIFITGGTKKQRELYCYNLKNSRLRWRRKVQLAADTVVRKLKVDKETGYAAPTPATDGKRVFALFPTGELVCCSPRGRVIWSRLFTLPKNHYGHASSLLADGGLLFVQLDQYDNGTLFALQVTNGKTVWKAKRDQLSWASPICVNTGDRKELILTDNLYVTSYDPLAGKVLWKFDCLYGEVGPSAAYASRRVFVAGETADAVGITLEKHDEKDTARILWRWNDNLPSTASPVATERFVFFATAEGIVSCVDALRGETVWEREFDEGFYASPVIVGDRVYIIDRKGTMRIFAADGAYTSLGNPALGEAVVATPAPVDGFLIIRGKKHLFCIEGSND